MEIKVKNVSIKAIDNLCAAGTTQTFTLMTLPPTAYVIDFMARVKTAFAGVTTPQVKVGGSTITDSYLILQDISKTGDLITGRGGRGFCERIRERSDKAEANKTMTATFTSQSGNFSSLTVGEIEFVAVYAE